MISDEEAAEILLMIEREYRLFNGVPRRRRSFRVPIDSPLPSSTSIVEHVSNNEDLNTHIPLMETPTKPTRNCKKRLPLFSPKGKQPKKTKRSTESRLAAGASSSGTREETPEWLLRLMARKNGAEPKKIIEKELTTTDVSSGHGRLSMPLSSIVDLEFLRPEEVRIIDEHVRKIRTTGVDAKLVCGFDVIREYDVNLRRWNMNKESGSKSPLYNLVTGWNKVVRSYGLKEKDNICLWSFHSNAQLYFALLRHPRPSDQKSEPENLSSALVIYDKSSDNLPPK